MRKPNLRHSLSASAALAATLVATGVAAAPVDLAALPLGTPAVPPTRSAAPGWIPASEKVAGIEPVVSRGFAVGYKETLFFADSARARTFQAQMKGERVPDSFTTSDTCFATPSTFRLPEEHDMHPLEWDTFSADQFAAQSYPGDKSPKVLPVRAERWVEADGKVRIKAVEFWVDVRSGGTRLISRSEHELGRVATPFERVGVYGLRTGDDSLAFFVRRDVPPNPRSSNAEPLQLIDTIPLGRSRVDAFDIAQFKTTIESEVRSNPCAFERLDLKVRQPEPPAPTSELLPAPGVTSRAKHVKTKKGFGGFQLRRDAPANATVALVAVLGVELETGLEPSPVTPAEPPGTAAIRPMVINLGIARAGEGAVAVPTVSYRWLDRSRAITF